MKRLYWTACCYCGRSTHECWVMPCLELQTLLDTDNAKALKLWARKSGAKLVPKAAS